MLWEAADDILHEDIRRERLAKYAGNTGFLGELRDALIPFRIGDRVSIELSDGRKLGNGVIEDISHEFERGMGTKLYPAFKVITDSGKWGWFNGVSLSRTLQKGSSEE